jgi:hypothetical protein
LQLNPAYITLYTRDQNMFEIRVFILFAYNLLFNSNILLQFSASSQYMGILMALLFPFLIIVSGIYFYDIILVKKRLNMLDMLIFMTFPMPIYNAFCVHYCLDAKLFKSIFNQSARYFIAATGFIYYLIRTNKFTLKQNLFSALSLCWFSFFLYIYLHLTLNPATYKDDENLVGYNPNKGGYIFRFASGYLIFGIVYYFLAFIIQDSLIGLFLWLCLIAYQLFFDKGRSELISMLIPLALYMLFALHWSKIVTKTLQLALMVGLMFLIAWWIDPKLLNFASDMFMIFFKFILGMDTGEKSADSRWIQFGLVYDYFRHHPNQIFFGVGVPKQLTMFMHIGDVNLTDIGIVGIVMTQGIVGTIYYLLIFLFPIYVFRKVKFYRKDILFNTGILGCAVTFIQSMFTGGFIYAPFSLFYFLMFVEYYRVKENLYWKNLTLANNT